MAVVEEIMRALSDPTRRAVFERVASSGEITVGDLTRGSGVTQGAISQHLKTLKMAKLVSDRAQGRRVYYRVRPAGLEPLSQWINRQTAFWNGRLDSLEQLLRADEEQDSSKGETDE